MEGQVAEGRKGGRDKLQKGGREGGTNCIREEGRDKLQKEGREGGREDDGT